MGLLYKTFQSLSYDGLEWAKEKGINYNKKLREEQYANQPKYNLYDGYCKLDSILKKVKKENALSDNNIYDDYDDYF